VQADGYPPCCLRILASSSNDKHIWIHMVPAAPFPSGGWSASGGGMGMQGERKALVSAVPGAPNPFAAAMCEGEHAGTANTRANTPIEKNI